MIGQLVSHYRVLEKLAAGGMGEVYLAEDTKLGRQVALKFLPAGIDPDPAILERFRREARATAALDHPNIVTVHEVGEHDGRPFIVMSYVRGVTLTAKIRAGQLSTEDAVRYAMQIAEGLAHAHQAHVVHRDIKPDNILVDLDDRPRLLDFGLARLEGVTRLTRESSTLGTLYYMSPEQARGDEADERSDIYSLGIVLYEMLTGRIPFEGDNAAAVLQAIATREAEPLARYNRNVSAELERITAKCMAKDRRERYASANDLLADLHRESRISDTFVGAAASERRARRPWLLPGIAVIALAAAFALYFGMRHDDGDTTSDGATGNTLAVMYFDNLTDRADEKRLGEILANLVITDLSETHGLNVLSSQRLYDLLKLEGKEGLRSLDRETSTAVARRAQARWMLLGSILQTEPEMIITAQLVDVATGSVEASQRIAGATGENVFAVSNRLLLELRSDLATETGAEIATEAPRMTGSEEAYRLYLEGVELANRYLWERADDRFEAALAADSTFAMAAYQLATGTFRRRGDERMQLVDQALRHIDRVGERDRMFIRQLHASLHGDETEALRILREMTRRFPDDKEVFYTLGRAVRWSNPQEAISAHLRAIEIDPLYKLPYNQLAYLYDQIGDAERSLRAVDKYIELAPNEPNPYDSRAELLARAGRFREAVAAYQQALSIEPRFDPARAKLGITLIVLGDYGTAQVESRKLLESSVPNWRSIGRMLIAGISLRQGHFLETLELLRQGIAADRLDGFRGDSFFDKLILEVQIEDLLGRGMQLERLLGELPLCANGAVDGWDSSLCELQARSGDVAAAERTLKTMEECFASNGTVEGLANARGWVAIAREDFEGAIEQFLLADSRESELWDRLPLAHCYMELGRIQEAIDVYERSLAYMDWSWGADPLSAILQIQLAAKAHERAGNRDRAIELYAQFLDLWGDPDTPLPIVDETRQRLQRLREGP